MLYYGAWISHFTFFFFYFAIDVVVVPFIESCCTFMLAVFLLASRRVYLCIPFFNDAFRSTCVAYVRRVHSRVLLLLRVIDTFTKHTHKRMPKYAIYQDIQLLNCSLNVALLCCAECYHSVCIHSVQAVCVCHGLQSLWLVVLCALWFFFSHQSIRSILLLFSFSIE